jgi:hypothetical protein
MRSSLISLVIFLFSPNLAWPGALNGIVSLPNQPTVNTMQRDTAGNLYIAGYVPAANPRSMYDFDAFVGKLSGDGGTVLYWTVFPGGAFEEVTAFTLAPDGTVLATGFTFSTDFPVTSNAAESQNTAPSKGNTFRVQNQIVTVNGPQTGFFVRLDANGQVAYASYLNGSATVAESASPLAIAGDASGAAYISGVGNFSSTSGALPTATYLGGGYFLRKLDVTGKTVFTTGGIGGSQIALDGQGAIYIAGNQQAGFPLPETAGAFQSTIVNNV